MKNIFDLFKQIETEKPAEPTPISAVIVGLGNPGAEYAKTRHNMGFMCIDYISQKLGAEVTRSRFSALCGELKLGSKRVLLMKPQTYMNKSGEAVRDALDFYKLTPAELLVFSDDISLPVGTMKIKRKGSDGGQKGLRDIIYQLGSDNFARAKIGVGTPPPGFDVCDWVLGKLPESDWEAVYGCIEAAPNVAELVVSGEIDKAMGLYNQAKKS